MEIGLVILVVLAIVAVAVVLRKRKAQEAERLDDAASPARAPGARPASAVAARPDPAAGQAAAARDPAPRDPSARKAEVLREQELPLGTPAPEAPPVPASDEEQEPSASDESVERAASPPPTPVRTPTTPRAAETSSTEGTDAAAALDSFHGSESAETASAQETEDDGAESSDAESSDAESSDAGSSDAESSDAGSSRAVQENLDTAARPSARVEASAKPAPSGAWLGLRKGLAKSRESTGFFGRLKQLLGGRRELDPNIAERLEEILLSSDVGMATTERILARLKDGISRGDLADEARVLEALRVEAARTLAVDGFGGAIRAHHQPTVVLFVGVNGAGKTTTIGKLAQNLTAQGKKVMLAAGDTFRAAAVDQLKVWGRRVNCEVVTGKEGADPSSVLFDAIQAAKAARVDVLLADTAGRLHTKANLMQEMTKVQKVAAKALEGAPHETLLVIDATNGQNALAQAREFKEALPITGLVLTKLDGTAKGGVVLGICDALRIPVRYVGVGERAEDLHEFDPAAFVEALLGAENEVIAA